MHGKALFGSMAWPEFHGYTLADRNRRRPMITTVAFRPIADLRGDAISLTCCVLKRTLSSGTRVRTSWAGKLLTYGKKGVCYRTRYLLS
jgi:hypothetical protein